MTIEVGVVRGNFERVQNELQDLLVQLRVKTNNPDELVHLETQLEAVNIRANAFLRNLGSDDDGDNAIPVDPDQSASSDVLADKLPDLTPVETVQSAEKLTNPDNPLVEISDNDPSISPAEQSAGPRDLKTPETADISKQSDSSFYSRQAVSNEKNNQSEQLILLQEKLDQVMAMIEQQSVIITELAENIKANQSEDVNVSEDFSKVLNEYLAIASGGVVIADQALAGPMLSVINSAEPATLLANLPTVMEQLADQVMQPSLVVFSYLQKVLQAPLNPDQKNVIQRLVDYQKTNIDKQVMSDPLPSPWQRGMKELFD